MEVYTPEKKMPAEASETGIENVEQKRSCPPVCKTERQCAEDNERTLDHGNVKLFPCNTDITMQSGTAQGFFERILPKGAENGIKTDELLRMTGLSEARTIRRLISDERAAGAVILSGDTGYYLPDEGEKGRREVVAFVAAIKAKGKNTMKAARSAEAFLAKLPGQMEIGGGNNGEE